MSKFYRGMNDVVFKTIFSKESNRYLLKRLLRETLKLSDIEILDVGIEELPKNIIKSKKRTVDLVIKSKGKIINVEINTYDDKTYHRISFSYLANLYVNGLKEGQDYSSMEEYIQINISTKEASISKDYDIYKVTGERYRQEFIDNFKIYEFNTTNLKEKWYNEYRFIQLLDCDEEEIEKYQGDEEMEKLGEEIKRLNKNPEFVELMSEEEEYEKYINTEKNFRI